MPHDDEIIPAKSRHENLGNLSQGNQEHLKNRAIVPVLKMLKVCIGRISERCAKNTVEERRVLIKAILPDCLLRKFIPVDRSNDRSKDDAGSDRCDEQDNLEMIFHRRNKERNLDGAPGRT